MYKSIITAKGQTTIPIEIRKKLNLTAGDNIEYYVNDDGTFTIFPNNVDITELVGILPKPKKAASVEEMNRAIGKRRRGDDRK